MKSVVALLSIFIIQFIKADEVKHNIPFYYKAKPPLVNIEGGTYVGGIYYDSFKAILNESKIKFSLSPLPKSRSRQHFWEGRSQISCCENPAWRTFPKEMEVQLFSKPFMQLRDLLIVNKNFSKNLKDSKSLHYALYRGYSYKGDVNFKRKTYLSSMDTMLKFVELGRADVTIVSEFTYLNYMKRKKANLKIGDVFSEDTIHIRVHRNSKNLLNVINKSIEKLKARGEFKRIVEENLK
jgi:hypothetical protein